MSVLGNRWMTVMCRLLAVTVFGVWLLDQPVQARFDCNLDNECQPENGEDCLNCGEDCENLCVCGDGRCDYPAEGSELGTGFECIGSGNPECQICNEDCGGGCTDEMCFTQWDGLICDESSGQCTNCTQPGDCPPFYTCNEGTCVPEPTSRP